MLQQTEHEPITAGSWLTSPMPGRTISKLAPLRPHLSTLYRSTPKSFLFHTIVTHQQGSKPLECVGKSTQAGAQYYGRSRILASATIDPPRCLYHQHTHHLANIHPSIHPSIHPLAAKGGGKGYEQRVGEVPVTKLIPEWSVNSLHTTLSRLVSSLLISSSHRCLELSVCLSVNPQTTSDTHGDEDGSLTHSLTSWSQTHSGK